MPEMSWRIYLPLAFLGLGLALVVAQFQPFPGYLDSDYYFAGGMQLAQGKGFSEPYLWNYLDDPQGLPHPSHTYWMPLSSILAAWGMWLTRQTTYSAGRLAFLVLAALSPVVTAALAYDLSRRRELALPAGLLAVFSIYYAPFLPVPDNYGPYLVLGGLYFLAARGRGDLTFLALGLLSGLMTLARSDGLIWLAATFLLCSWHASQVADFGRRLTLFGRLALFALSGFLLVMGPWFWRNYSAFGRLLAPGGERLLWLRTYDETFAYPAAQLNMQSWLAQGWANILAARAAALRWNLLNAFAAQGGIFLLPFILAGIWERRAERRVRLAMLVWLGLLFVMTAVFPYAGSRGGFFHAGAALQPLWWALAPLGLEGVVRAARRRRLFTPDAFRIFRVGLVGIAALMSGLILYLRVLQGWGEGEHKYPLVEAFLRARDARPDEIVIVRNPPGYFLMTGRPAIVMAYGDESTMLALARRYQARYLVLEAAGAAGPIRDVYENLHSQQLRFLGEVEDVRIFEIQP